MTVPAMPSAIPRNAYAITEPLAPAPPRDSVLPVHAPRVMTFFATLWTAVALAIVGSYDLSIRIGAPRIHPMEFSFIAAIYLMWVPLAPFLVAFARRYPPSRVLVHASVALALIVIKHFLHRFVFCAADGAGSWIDCVLGVRFEPWFVRWILGELLVYAATVGGTWAFDAGARAEARELSVAEKERELAGAELRAAQARIAPQEITARLASIARQLRADPEEAERMITRVADSLRAMRSES